MSEDSATCRIHSEYPKIKCANPALPRDAEGLCILHSRQQDKDREKFIAAVQSKMELEAYDFSGVIFPEGFRFPERTFKKYVIFSYAKFLGDISFTDATFVGRSSFKETEFSGKTDFNSAIFCGQSTFEEAKFRDDAYFFHANFFEMVFFIGAEFYGRAYFSGAAFMMESDFQATFFKDVVFEEAGFYESADFDKAIFLERATFKSINRRQPLIRRNKCPNASNFNGVKWPPPFKGKFGDIKLQDKGALCFQDLSLSDVCFEGTDLREVEFKNVSWPCRWGRNIIYDEFLFYQPVLVLEEIPNKYRAEFKKPTRETYARIEDLYRQLKLNYQKEGDLKNVSDFYYGEMEMYRRASKWRWFPYRYNLYWALSGYGERPFRALGWLAGFLLVFPLTIWLLGLDISSPGQSPGFWETFSYMFEKVTLKRPELASINSLGRFIISLGLLIIPGQAALFLLALRNRLGRRR
jgi:uncharacterized protein YjbI with pentapeptide repeats